MAFYCEKGKGCEPDMDKCIETNLKAAELEDPNACFNLGRLYKNVKNDYENSKKYFKLSADCKYDKSENVKGFQGMNIISIVQSQVNYANYLVEEKNFDEALKYYQKAIDSKYPPYDMQAYFNLGLMYLKMDEFKKAIPYFEKAQKLGAKFKLLLETL